jgi:para-nitrobenzyl esterase
MHNQTHWWQKNIAVVSTDLGKVRGYIHNGTFTYKGIPYAQSERFMPPTRPKAWSDVRSSTAYGCMSYRPNNNGV